MITEFKIPTPIVIRSGHHDPRYDLMIYKSSDMRAVIERCAQICEVRMHNLAHVHEIRKLLEQVK
jgi:hypothetical protein